MEVYDIKNISFTYAGSSQKTLSDLSLSIEQGEFLVLCGKSGCGKTTLLRQLKTVLTPYGHTDGELKFFGQPLDDISLREQAQSIGYVMQHPDHQIVTDKVWHELAFGMENLGFCQETIQLRVAEMAGYLGISDLYYKNVSELSGGQKQLMNLAAVLVMQPEILILDEPTSQLDPLAAGEFVQIIKKVNEEFGTTILFSTHCLEDVFALADRIVVMENGRILADDTPRCIGGKIRGNDMEEALPIPVQAAIRLGIGYNGTGYPVSVREGKDYLNNICMHQGQKTVFCGKEDRVVEKKGQKTFFGGVPAYSQFMVSAKDIWFRYEKNGEDVISDFSLHIQKGEIYALLGANGSGKTTAMMILGGLKKPYRGQIKIDGQKLESCRKNQHFLAILPQDVQTLFAGDTVEEDLQRMCSDIRNEGIPEEDILRRYAQIISDMEIGNLLSLHPYDLSGGEAQRAALAKVLLTAPKLLFLDEPTKGMDACYKNKFGELLNRQKKNGITILFISHDVEFAARYADTCGLLFQGKVAAEKTAREFFCGNSFYTTGANRMGRHLYPDVVTIEDLVAACKGGQHGHTKKI